MEYTFNDANFASEVLQSPVPVLVDCWAEWCGPCRAMAPIIEELAHEIDSSKVRIGKLNVDGNSKTPEEYDISSIPTFLMFNGGRLVEKFTGSITKASLIEKIKKYAEI